jgi:hypothetical protein
MRSHRRDEKRQCRQSAARGFAASSISAKPSKWLRLRVDRRNLATGRNANSEVRNLFNGHLRGILGGHGRLGRAETGHGVAARGTRAAAPHISNGAGRSIGSAKLGTRSNFGRVHNRRSFRVTGRLPGGEAAAAADAMLAGALEWGLPLGAYWKFVLWLQRIWSLCLWRLRLR